MVKLDIICDSTLFHVNTEIINLHQAGATVRKQRNVACWGEKVGNCLLFLYLMLWVSSCCYRTKQNMKTNLGIPNISLLSFMVNQDHSASKYFNGELKL